MLPGGLQPFPAEASYSSSPEGVKRPHPPLAHLARSQSGTLGTTASTAELTATGEQRRTEVTPG